MATDLRIALPNRPGALESILRIVAEEGINLLGLCGDLRPGERWGYVHIAVEDGAKAKEVIERAGYEVLSVYEVVLEEVEDRPGAMADLLRKYRESERNLEVLFVGSGNRIILGTDDMLADRQGVTMRDTER